MAYISRIVDLQGNIYYFDAIRVNNHTVEKDVPSNAIFTDTTYQLFTEEMDTTKGGLVSLPELPSGADPAQYYLTANGEWQKLADDLSVLVESDLRYVKDDTSGSANHIGTVIGDVANNQAIGQYSVAAGQGTIATQNDSLAIGRYNKTKSGEMFVIGVGTNASTNRKSAFSVLDNGNIYLLLESGDPLYNCLASNGPGSFAASAKENPYQTGG